MIDVGIDILVNEVIMAVYIDGFSEAIISGIEKNRWMEISIDLFLG